MDFFRICTKEPRRETDPVEVRPDFVVGRSRDLMVRGQSFYAIWDEEAGLWSTDEYDVRRLVDQKIQEYVDEQAVKGIVCNPKFLHSFGTNGWVQFRKFLKNVSDNSKPLDMKLTFANTEVKKSDYASRRLPYSLAMGDYSAWDELVGTLYSPEERAKIEWAIGAIISGDAKKIEKFLVFYGPGGTGKSTILKIIQKLFEGYIAMFEAKALVGNNNAFATEAFKNNPLVAIQHDGDLSKIEDNSTLNSVVGHDTMRINEKYKPGYEAVINAFLFMGTNKPVKITDAKSGLIRRLIDVKPTGVKLDFDHYQALMSRIDFELGAIAYHCLEVYKSMGKSYYNTYQPLDMMLQTDVFFNFIEAYYDIFKAQDGTTLKQAYTLYKEYVVEAGLEYKLPMYKFREELKNYFEEFLDRAHIDGAIVRSAYSGFTASPFKEPVKPETQPRTYQLLLEETESLLDEMYSGLPAQYGKENGTPAKYWTDDERLIDGRLQKPKSSQIVSTVLGDLDTSKLHFLKVPENHIVIDFDLKGDDGEKSLEKNLGAASVWPPTYAELSKSGAGVHLHYIYDGDVTELAREYSDGIEIKVYSGNGSLRRRLSKCNSVSVATLSSGLPFKEKKPMLQTNTIKSEKGLRDLIAKNLRKEVHPGTKPSVDFIKKILDDAHESGMVYDVTDLRPRIMEFANNSTNQALNCLRAVQQMKFKSEISSEEKPRLESEVILDNRDQQEGRLVFFDCEVYPNLFVVCWKYQGSPTVVRMINPTPQEMEALFKYRLVGFNNRSYDNHILWGRFMGFTNEELYNLSQKIIVEKNNNAKFGEAYNLSYADIWDFAKNKQGLKKWEIELGLHHMEMDIPWDQPVPDDMIDKVVEYCCNDVMATEAVFEHCKSDFAARQILANMSGLSVNSPTRQHVTKIIFGDERNPQSEFVYTDLSEEFPGYKYDEFAKPGEKSTYRGEFVGEGGYVYAEPGMYEDVVLLDVASMHPTSIIQLNLFGKYTEKFKDLVKGRLAIKNANQAWKDAAKLNDQREQAKDLPEEYLLYSDEIEELNKKADNFLREAQKLLPGIEVTKENAGDLAEALKLVINSIYGYTSATFPNPFRDPRNKDNIVAKRGALFMIDLKHFVQENGFQAVHIKTDSIKIPGAGPLMIQKVMEFGKKYGYTFEHENTYDKFCLVNDAVYIARTDTPTLVGIEHKWSATGAEFKHPYIFKTLFSGEPIKFEDLCETRSVTSPSSMYLDFGPEAATPAEPEKGMKFVGRTGSFVPVYEGANLVRVKDGKSYAVTGTKGYSWLESEMVKQLNDLDLAFFDVEAVGKIIDMRYFDNLAAEAKKTIEKFGSYEELVR